MTARILGVALGQWDDIDGWSTAKGIALEDLPPSRLCNLIMHLLYRNRDEKDRAKLDAQLLTPPPEAMNDPDALAGSRWSAESEMASFMAGAKRAGAM